VVREIIAAIAENEKVDCLEAGKPTLAKLDRAGSLKGLERVLSCSGGWVIGSLSYYDEGVFATRAYSEQLLSGVEGWPTVHLSRWLLFQD